jgi:hypothetical protein
MVVESRSRLYLGCGYSRKGKRLVDTTKESPLGYVHSILRGERKLGRFNNWYVLHFIKGTYWRYKDEIRSDSKASIRLMPNSQFRYMFYVDNRPCSFRAMGYKNDQLTIEIHPITICNGKYW